jgi:hypothetical protein
VLRNRGLFRTEYTGSSLREHFGIPHPAHPAKHQRAAGTPGLKTSAAG